MQDSYASRLVTGMSKRKDYADAFTWIKLKNPFTLSQNCNREGPKLAKVKLAVSE